MVISYFLSTRNIYLGTARFARKKSSENNAVLEDVDGRMQVRVRQECNCLEIQLID